ncbi:MULTISPECIES: hypothetical protein [Vibrio]|uniref:Uncharacterized protein n=3 Tax=Vibrio TaxID=662 RepID=A0A1N6MBB5_9VIBR|nr:MULTISPECIES: hypothetical protein [Vibrio]ASA56418.1 hypothetical protein BSQ33_12415 [Vibrio gazogenes]KUI99939.1 hypothetical protein VRK_06520 [Vibrio sp. MEBiC08052]MDW6092049.1 hypothetical protein [Vibrio rhizosphaerae]WNJ96010.1 hypothetical protein RND59_02525 [Vibrio ruber]SIO96703.1 hypothetical protein VSP9026_04509 [Vibrio spartinae]
MSASVQTINKFCEETGMSRTKVKELINDCIIPTIPQEQSGGLVLINKLEFDRRIAANQIMLPIPPRKRKLLDSEA